MQVAITRLVQRTKLRLVDPDQVALGTGIASMFPEHGVRVIVDEVRAATTPSARS
jgi:hypothetical protein